jgi:hypothetical protein
VPFHRQNGSIVFGSSSKIASDAALFRLALLVNSCKHGFVLGEFAQSFFLEDMMIITRKSVGLAILASMASLSVGQFTVTGAGPYNSWGYQGDPNNSTINSSYSGASTLFGSFSISGTLTDVAAGAWASDSSWIVSNNTRGNGFGVTPGANGTYSSVNVSGATTGLFWANQNDAYTFESAQNFDNDLNGNDAVWTNMSMSFSGTPVVHALSPINAANPVTFDTIGSTYDTVIALYSSNGTLLNTDDDSGGNLTSQLSLGTMIGGSYYLTVASFGTSSNFDFQNGLALGGDDSGSTVVHLNGNSIYTGAHAANTLDTFSFTVVPEPATFVVLGGGLMYLAKRRRFRSN